jgi:hypothetical protein
MTNRNRSFNQGRLAATKEIDNNNQTAELVLIGKLY